MNTRTREILTGVVIIILAAGLLIAAELALYLSRTAAREQMGNRGNQNRYVTDPVTGLHVFEPNRQIGYIRINNLGFRGPDITEAKPAGTFRLAFLGSSTTLDGQSPEGRNWPHLLAKKLGEAVTGCSVDFVNAGIPRYGLAQLTELFEHRVAGTDPDLVIVMPGGVTAQLDSLARQQGFTRYRKRSASQRTGSSYVLARLERWFEGIIRRNGTETGAHKVAFELQQLKLAHTEELRALLKVLGDQQRLVGVVATTSRLSRTMTRHELRREHRELHEQRPYIYVPDLIDLREAFNQAAVEAARGFRAIALPGISDLPHDSRNFYDRMHFSSRGSELMSRQVFEQLLSHREVISLLEARGCSLASAQASTARSGLGQRTD